MNHWQTVLRSLPDSKEFWAAIAGAVGGGIFVVLTQWLSTLWQRRSERAAERRAVTGILHAIETEIEMFKMKYLNAYEKLFLNPEPEKTADRLPQIAPLRQNVSIVFDSNAAALGRITDAALRADIVSTYMTLKAVVDTVNHYADRRATWKRVNSQTNMIGLLEIQTETEKWATNVRNGIPKLNKEIAALLANIRKYVAKRS